MSVRRKITVAVLLTAFAWAGYWGYGLIQTVRRIPEAYAAWDTGSLLVAYMEAHTNQWPASWDELLTMREQVLFRGARAGDTNYAASLRAKVAINWKFDAARDGRGSPVTRLDGSKFPTVWKGAEPNEMVRRHLTASATNALGAR